MLAESEGFGLSLDLASSFLLCATLNGWLRLWDVSRREAKSHYHPKQLAEQITEFGEIISARVNTTGNKVSRPTTHNQIW